MIVLMSWSCPPAHKFLNNGVTLPLVKGNPFFNTGLRLRRKHKHNLMCH